LVIETVHLSRAELRQRQIVDLDRIAAELPQRERELFARLYDVVPAVGHVNPPEHMRRWINKYFGDVDAVTEQKVVKVTNRWTLDCSLFNELRARRPLEARIPVDLADEIARTAPDPFCEPELNTPEDVFGRIHGKYTVTASNIAKYDGFHGVVIFNEHDPLAFTEASVQDAINVSRQWFDACAALDAAAVYPLIMWNCLWKSGASIPHGHMQVSLTSGMHYGKVEKQRRSSVAYREQFGSSYYDDVYSVHESLGLGRTQDGVRVMAHLTPLKEKACVIFGERLDEGFVRVVYETLNCLTDHLNVVSFNLVIWLPPLADTAEDWSDFPIIAQIVDRGDPLNRTADFGAMELYAASVVSSDPFKVADAIWGCFDGAE
jgi:hypothetical protein